MPNIILCSPFADLQPGTDDADEIYGLGGDDILEGLGGDDYLDGGTGVDDLHGGLGSDTYVVDEFDDEVFELAGEGYDTVIAMMGYSLVGQDHIEQLILAPAAGTDGASGNGQNNTIIGNNSANSLLGLGGNDILDGGLGDDTMIGGTGGDRYYVRDANDSVVENAGEGADEVFAAVTHTLSDYVENLFLNLSTDPINGTGNDLNNSIFGNAAANVLNGLLGNDNLQGNGGNDTLFGGDDNDILDGGTGADQMNGGFGHDNFWVDNLGDQVVGGAGTDMVFSSVNFTLGADVENLRLLTGAFVGTGNAGANEIYGNAGNNMLVGGGGNDLLDGEGGFDTAGYSGNRADYVVTQLANGDVQVSDQRPGSPSGTDTLRDMAQMNFADGNFATVAPLGDVVWRHSIGTVAVGEHVVGDAGWSYEIAGTGDFDADGDADILWREDNGDVLTWEMNGDELGLVNQNFANVSGSYQIVGTGDFDADGDDDILWRHDNGSVVTWEMQDGDFVDSHSIETAGNSWQIEGAGDLDGDGDADILWRHDNGNLVSWEMEDGAYVATHNIGNMIHTAQMAAIDDFDGDGDGDILWRNPAAQCSPGRWKRARTSTTTSCRG